MSHEQLTDYNVATGKLKEAQRESHGLKNSETAPLPPETPVTENHSFLLISTPGPHFSRSLVSLPDICSTYSNAVP
jgi:hypothetical protein